VIDPWETNGGHPQIPGSGSYSLPLDEVLLSQMLKTHGYATHIVTIPRPTIFVQSAIRGSFDQMLCCFIALQRQVGKWRVKAPV
jgi:hypothetical protein